MKKHIINHKYAHIYALLSLFVVSMILAGCRKKEPTIINYYTYNYACDEGGYIIGNTSQTVEVGQDLEEVTAIASDGYRFVKWSDDVTTPSRKDTNINSSTSIYALFSPIGFEISFVINGDAYIDIYNPVDYSLIETKVNSTYSRNINTGDYTMFGESHVIFKVIHSDLLFVKAITYFGSFDDVFSVDSDSLTNAFDLVNIKSNVTINIDILNAKDIDAIGNFASKNLSNGNIYFSYEIMPEYKIKNIECIVNDGLTDQIYNLGTNSSWVFDEGKLNKLYTFEFNAISSINNIVTNKIEVSRYTLDNINFNIPTIEINTENYILPTFDKISAPIHNMGAGITNNEYVQSHLSIFDSEKNVVYESSESQKDYSGSKIKIRGNTSAYLEKTPYKIKLSKKADLLKPFINRLPNCDYKHKEWLLLNTGVGSVFNYLVGTETNRYLGAESVPEYIYCCLLINGDFKGVYLLTESISRGTSNEYGFSRINVSKTGFIIENDAYWWNEDLYFESEHTSAYSTAYTFKYPDSDDINTESEEYMYIKNYINKLEEYLHHNDSNVFNYLDKDSFAIWILTHDLIGSYDAAGSNMYLTKYDSTDNSKICMGPTWDYDRIFDTDTNFSNHHFAIWFYYPLLFNYDEFLDTYCSLYENKITSYKATIDSILYNYNTTNFNNLIMLDGVRWRRNVKSIEEQINDIDAWMENRKILLDSLITNI